MDKNLTEIIAGTTGQNNLINGKMSFDCSNTTQECEPNACISTFKFEAGKKHLLRLINAGSQGQQKFSIDGHDLTVVAHDFVPLEPYTVNMISLGVGQRYDVVVHANKKKDSSHFMRSSIQTNCTPSTQPHALAAIYYPKADRKVLPILNPQPDTLPNCSNANYPLALTKPIFKKTPDLTPGIVHNIEISFGPNATGYLLWMMNKSSFRANFNNPILLLANKGNLTYPTNWNVYNSGEAKSIRVVLINNSRLPHPMHIHGEISILDRIPKRCADFRRSQFLRAGQWSRPGLGWCHYESREPFAARHPCCAAFRPLCVCKFPRLSPPRRPAF